jgi:hypothetical protein
MAVWEHARPGDMTTGARRSLLYVLVLVLVLIGGSYYQSSHAINLLRVAVQTQCASARDIADLAHGKLMTDPKTGKPSRILVNYLGHQRVVFYGLGCPGRLKSPSPQFVHWAKVYHVPYR